MYSCASQNWKTEWVKYQTDAKTYFYLPVNQEHFSSKNQVAHVSRFPLGAFNLS